MLIALLKLVLCFTKKNKFIDKHNLLANNFEIQLQLIAGILIQILYFYQTNIILKPFYVL